VACSPSPGWLARQSRLVIDRNCQRTRSPGVVPVQGRWPQRMSWLCHGRALTGTSLHQTPQSERMQAFLTRNLTLSLAASVRSYCIGTIPLAPSTYLETVRTSTAITRTHRPGGSSRDLPAGAHQVGPWPSCEVSCDWVPPELSCHLPAAIRLPCYGSRGSLEYAGRSRCRLPQAWTSPRRVMSLWRVPVRAENSVRRGEAMKLLAPAGKPE
jgi:hypothetical protein